MIIVRFFFCFLHGDRNHRALFDFLGVGRHGVMILARKDDMKRMDTIERMNESMNEWISYSHRGNLNLSVSFVDFPRLFVGMVGPLDLLGSAISKEQNQSLILEFGSTRPKRRPSCGFGRDQ